MVIGKLAFKYRGRIWWEDHWWLVEVPELDVMSQGRSRRGALSMICDAIETLFNEQQVKVRQDEDSNEFTILLDDTFNTD